HSLGINDPGHRHGAVNSGTGLGSANRYVAADVTGTDATANQPLQVTGISLNGGVNNGSLSVSDTIGVSDGITINDLVTIGPQTGSEPVDSAAYLVVNVEAKL